MNGARCRVYIEDAGFLVLTDPDVQRGYVVNTTAGEVRGRYDLDDTNHFRFGTVEREKSGRVDCLSWLDFTLELQEQTF